MYRVIIVDDEMPALRYLDALIDKHAPHFQADALFTSAKKALEYLQDHPVDLLITDINMHGMDGIELATQARILSPDIHIIIVSGHAEFEYAKGAIQAGVDEYLLKPVDIPQFAKVLGRIAAQLKKEHSAHTALILSAVACGQPYDRSLYNKLFGKKEYRFTLVRLGNPEIRRLAPLAQTQTVDPSFEPFAILQGRNDNERILLSTHADSAAYLADLGVYMAQNHSNLYWTVVYSGVPHTVDQLPAFIHEAIGMVSKMAVIGKNQMLQHPQRKQQERTLQIPSSEIKHFVYLVSSGKTKQFKEYLLNLAAEWERIQAPQQQAWRCVRHIAHSICLAIPSLNNQLDAVLDEMLDLIDCAQSYGELLMGLYSVLFDDVHSRDRKLSSDELYQHVTDYIDAHYSTQISMQDICDEMGISRTYLSRLFRKYGDTTFNIYLTNCRIKASAALLLAHPEYRMRDIAAFVGYDDPSYWGKVFRQVMGCTPSQYLSMKK